VKKIVRMRKCARPGCGRLLTKVQLLHAGQKCCSQSCAQKNRIGPRKVNRDVDLMPGDRWEKVAPKMEYTELLRDREIQEVYFSEIHRGSP
jgi:hypothetical protein